jgi:hypothetical protein
MALGGTNAPDFNEAISCGYTVQPGANCTTSVTFTPSAAGARSAKITITDSEIDSPQTITVNESDAGSPQTVALSGTGK